MRRNTVTIVKYLLVGAIFCIAGPLTLRALFGGKDGDGVARMDHGARGLPEAPRDPRSSKGPSLSRVSTLFF